MEGEATQKTTETRDNSDAEQAQGASKREYQKDVDPLSDFSVRVPGNVIRLATSHKAHAFYITFDNNPNDGLPKDQRHPVIQILRDFGGSWRDAPDGTKGWKIGWPIPDGERFSPYPHGLHEKLKMLITEQLAPAMGGVIERGASR